MDRNTTFRLVEKYVVGGAGVALREGGVDRNPYLATLVSTPLVAVSPSARGAWIATYSLRPSVVERW